MFPNLAVPPAKSSAGNGGKRGRRGGREAKGFPCPGEVVPSGLPGCPAPGRLARGWQPPGHPSIGSRPRLRSWGGVPMGSPRSRVGGAGGERRSGAGSGGSRGGAGAGGGGFLAAGFAAELVVAGDGAVASQDLHLAEDGLVPEARLPWRGTGTEQRQAGRRTRAAPTPAPSPWSQRTWGAPLAGCCQTLGSLSCPRAAILAWEAGGGGGGRGSWKTKPKRSGFLCAGIKTESKGCSKPASQTRW